MKRLLIVGSGDLTERRVTLLAALAKGGSLPQHLTCDSSSVVNGDSGEAPEFQHG